MENDVLLVGALLALQLGEVVCVFLTELLLLQMDGVNGQ